MWSKWRTVLVCALGVPALAQAENVITVWEATGTYNLWQDPWRRVEITSAGLFKIQATGDHNGLGEIRSITVAPNVTGTVQAYLLRRPEEGGGPGAYDVRLLNLSGNAITEIAELSITHDLGADGNVLADRIDGPLSVGNAILRPIIVQCVAGDISCNSMHDLTATGSGCGPVSTITVRGAYSHTIDITGELPGISIGGQLWGTIKSTGNARGAIWINGWVSGRIDIGGDFRPEAPELLLDIARNLAGSVRIGNDLRGKVWVHGTVSGTGIKINIEGDVLAMNPLGYDVQIDGGLAGTLRVGGDLLGSASIAGLVSEGGSVEIGGQLGAEPAQLALHIVQLDGTVHVGTDLVGQAQVNWLHSSGVLEVGQDLKGSLFHIATVSGKLVVNRHMDGFIMMYDMSDNVADLRGSLTVGGDLTGSVSIEGNLTDPNGDLAGGHIIINGSLRAREGASITLGGGFAGSTEFIAVDYDGWQAGDSWDAGATIFLEHGDDPDEIFTANTPSAHVWEITPCKADMNNNGAVTFADINPFVLALNDPNAYALAYPGLGGTAADPNGGSMVFHGDCNCDGWLNSDDVDPFVQRLYDGCCDPNCGDCPGGDGGGRPSPQQLARQLATHIAPELYDALVTLVWQVATFSDDADTRTYWHAVYVALTS